MTLNTGVFDGPGLPLLIELEQCGFDLDVRRGELWVRPVEQLTAEQRASIQHHRDELVTLVRICDDGVQKRLLTFKQQLSQVPRGHHPRPRVQARYPLRQGRLFLLRGEVAGATVWPLLALFAGVADGGRGADPGRADSGV